MLKKTVIVLMLPLISLLVVAASENCALGSSLRQRDTTLATPLGPILFKR